jgi:cytochrome c551/c552
MWEDLMQRLVLLLMLVLAVTLVACGGGESASEDVAEIPEGNAAAGETLFAQTLVGTQAGCITCHSLEPGITMVGPSLANIGADAGSRVSGQSAEDYLWQSIENPNDYLVEGFSAGLMPAALADELSAQEKSDLVAYLLTLK